MTLRRRLIVALLGGVLGSAAVVHGDTRDAHRVHIEGAGAVTVVFEAGPGDTLDVWVRVQPRVADSIVAELRGELQARGLAPPYVLVGHSLGGLYLQCYARNYPGEVAGLLLVDATHREQLQRMREVAPAT